MCSSFIKKANSWGGTLHQIILTQAIPQWTLTVFVLVTQACLILGEHSDSLAQKWLSQHNHKYTGV